MYLISAACQQGSHPDSRGTTGDTTSLIRFWSSGWGLEFQKDKAPKKKILQVLAVIRQNWTKSGDFFQTRKTALHQKPPGQSFLNEPAIEKKNSSPVFPHKLQVTVNLRIARHETVQWLADKGETSSSSSSVVIQRQILAPIKVIFKGVHHLQDGFLGHKKPPVMNRVKFLLL